MILTNKSEEHFREWFLINNGHISLSDRFYKEFTEMPLSFQYGVIVDFFASKGYDLDIDVDEYSIFSENTVSYAGKDNVIEGIIFEKDLVDVFGRPEARKRIVKKMNEIYNNRN